MFCKNPSIMFKSNRTWPSCNPDKVYTLKPELLNNPTMYQQSPIGMLYGYKKVENGGNGSNGSNITTVAPEGFKVNNSQESCSALPIAIGLCVIAACFLGVTKQK